MQVFDRKNATPRPFSRRNASAGRLTEGRFRGGRPSTIWWSATEELVECHQIVGGVPPAHRCSGTPGGRAESTSDGHIFRKRRRHGPKLAKSVCRNENNVVHLQKEETLNLINNESEKDSYYE